LEYLQVRPNDTEANLLAARCARRAEFLEDYTGPWRELAESFSDYLAAARSLGAAAADVALEESLAQVQHGQSAADEQSLLERAQSRRADAPLILEVFVHRHLRRLQFDSALRCVE